jgi:hypothetical protein
MTRRRRFGKPLLIAAGLMGIAVIMAWFHLRAEDRRHARFYQTGKTVNAFLKEYCRSVEEAFDKQDPTRLLRHYSPESLPSPPSAGGWGTPETLAGGVTLQRLSGKGTVGADPISVPSYHDLQAIEETTCKIDLIESLEPHAVVLTVKFILDGVDRQGRFFQDRIFFRRHLTRSPVGEAEDGRIDWKIARDEVVEGVRVAGDRGGFLAVDPARVGLDYRHRRDPKLHRREQREGLRFGVIQHASGGVSAADYDRDGLPDLLFLDGRESRLFRNLGVSSEDGLPRFEDVTGAVGLTGIGEAHSGLFVDFDNDGDRDLFLARYLAPNRWYRNQGDGTFVEASAEVGLDAVFPATSATALDYDRDGFLDLYVAAYGNAFEAFPRLPFFARNGEANRLYRNVGGERFEDVTDAAGVGDTGWSLAVAATDVDGDGWADLAVANDFGRKTLYRNQGDGTFLDVAREAGVLDFSGGMGLAFGDFDNDGHPDLYTSNINSNQRWFGEDQTVSHYLHNVLRSRWLWKDWREYRALHALVGDQWGALGKQVGEGNSLFRNRGDGTFEELKDSDTQKAGWSWGVAFADFDNDTDLDLYAANGWISAEPGTDL